MILLEAVKTVYETFRTVRDREVNIQHTVSCGKWSA